MTRSAKIRYRSSRDPPSKSNNRSLLFGLGGFLYKKEGQAARLVYLSHRRTCDNVFTYRHFRKSITRERELVAALVKSQRREK